MTSVFARCASHRARRKLIDAIGRKPQGFWSWERKCTGGFYKIETAETDLARTIKGVTIVRGDTSDLRECWS